MMYEVKPVDTQASKQQKIHLHSEVVEILFENSRLIKNIFSNLKGIHGVTHMGLACVNPENELVSFSTSPNIEYNLIKQNLWLDDPCFNPDRVPKNTLQWWDESNEKIKLYNNRLTLGMTICRPVNNFSFLYSFATNEQKEGLHQYYEDNLFALMDMGDYFYKSLRGLYARYSLRHTPPAVNEFDSKASGLNIKPFLRVIKSAKTMR